VTRGISVGVKRVNVWVTRAIRNVLVVAVRLMVVLVDVVLSTDSEVLVWLVVVVIVTEGTETVIVNEWVCVWFPPLTERVTG